jgi:hypothetical protein
LQPGRKARTANIKNALYKSTSSKMV